MWAPCVKIVIITFYLFIYLFIYFGRKVFAQIKIIQFLGAILSYYIALLNPQCTQINCPSKFFSNGR